MNGDRSFSVMFCVVATIIALTFLGSLYSTLSGLQHGNTISFGINGAVETRCIDGFKFLVSDGGKYNGTNLQQLFDENGHAARCK